MNKYLAITIGPTLKTLFEARKTRELWAASFLLSSLSEKIIQQLDKDDKRTILPKIPKEVWSANRYGAGIYPDRIFMKAEELEAIDVETAIEAAIEALAKECLLQRESVDEQRVKEATRFWQSYFRVRYVIKEMDNITGGKLIKELSPYLDTLELEDTIFPEEPEQNELLYLFDESRIYQVPFSQSLKTGRGFYDAILSGKSEIPDTSQIASVELHRDGSLLLQNIAGSLPPDAPNEAFYEKIKEHKDLKPYFMPRHKYFCVVQADGDGIGNAISKLNDEQAYSGFSELLAIFGREAAEEINNYGGKPIYIGGDDLLFLAPVQNGEDNIFNLLEKLDKLFLAKDFDTKVSMSYGVNIVYYKYPLFQAINEAYGTLKTAKDYENSQKDKKNAIGFRLTKHSGSYFNGVFSKNFLKEVLKASDVFEKNDPGGRKGLVSSLMFKIRTLEELLKGLVNEEQENLSKRIAYFFTAFYNEWKGDVAFEAQKDAAKDLLIASFEEASTKDSAWLHLFYAIMRLFDFINEPSEKQQNDIKDTAEAVG